MGRNVHQEFVEISVENFFRHENENEELKPNKKFSIVIPRWTVVLC